MKNISSILTALILLVSSCSKLGSDGRPDNKTPEQENDFNITNLSAPDTVVSAQPIITKAEINSNDYHTYTYSLKLGGNTVFSKEVVNGEVSIETKDLNVGKYVIDVSVKNKDGIIKTKSREIIILSPVYGQAYFGLSKEGLIQAEKNKNNIDPQTVLVGLESKYNNAVGIEKVMYRNKPGFSTFVYYFKNGRFIAGEGYHTIISTGNSYAVLLGYKDAFTSYLGVDPVSNKKFTSFSESTYNALMTNRDFLTISTYVRTGQFSESNEWATSKYYANQYIKLGSQNAVMIHSEIGLK